MRRNSLHPERIIRRLRTGDGLLIENEKCDGVLRMADSLRDKARHYDDLADIWERPDRSQEARDKSLHFVCHYRRIARRLRDTAEALERDQAAGPWISLDQPFVDLSEARPVGQEAH